MNRNGNLHIRLKDAAQKQLTLSGECFLMPGLVWVRGFPVHSILDRSTENCYIKSVDQTYPQAHIGVKTTSDSAFRISFGLIESKKAPRKKAHKGISPKLDIAT
eukprot:4819675-Amphidinium_carterae.1